MTQGSAGSDKTGGGGTWPGWGGPNQDNVYHHAHIDPALRYRIRGHMHSCDDFVLHLRVGFMHMEEWGTKLAITGSDRGIRPGDEFELFFGGGPELYRRESYNEARLRGNIGLRKFFDRDHHLSASLAYVADLASIDSLDTGAPPDAVAAKGRTFLGYPQLALRFEAVESNYYSGLTGLRGSMSFELAASATGSGPPLKRWMSR